MSEMFVLSVEEIILIFVAYWCLMFALIIVFKMRGRGKLKALVLSPSLKFSVKAGKADGNKVKLGKRWTPTFKPDNIFEEKKSWFKFWRNPLRLILIVEKGKEALGWKEPDKKELSELAHSWTTTEIVKFIKKEVLKARMSSKPMSNGMFFLLLMMNLAMVLVVLLGFMRLGAF